MIEGLDGLVVTDEVRDLLAPGAAMLSGAAAALRPAPPLRVRFGATDGFSALQGDDLTLSDALRGPQVQHPLDAAAEGAGVDRWRRGLGLVVEALALRDLSEHSAAPPWLLAGLAVDAADTALAGLQLADQALALAARTGDFAAHPRAGVAVVRAVGRERATAWLEGGVGARAWFDAAQAFLGAQGLASRLGLAVTVPEVDVPADLPPWSWRRVLVPAHPRGGSVRARGGACGPCWAVGGEVLRALAVGMGQGGSLQPEVGGPVGSWDLSSAAGFGSFFGARGMTWQIHGSGKVDFILADAFVGSVQDLPASERVGTSGLAVGRWRVAGPRQLAFYDIRASGLTMHGRQPDADDGDVPFAMPSGGVGLGGALEVLTEAPWRWDERDGRLHLRGFVSGGALELRLAPSAAG